MSNKNTYFSGSFDLLKTISIILVLLWHLQPFRYKVLTESNTLSIINNVLYFFNVEVTAIAVPIFLIVSLYLFVTKSYNNDSYFYKRLLRIGTLTVFWVGIQFIIFFLFHGLYIDKNKLVESIPMGGPDLPLVSESVFYFLVVLFFLIIVIHALQKFPRKRKSSFSIILVLLSLSYFEYMNLSGRSIPFWRIDNFLIYAPSAFLLEAHTDRLLQLRRYFFLGYVFFAFQDFYLGGFGGGNSHYARISIYFGSLSLFLFCINRRNKKESPSFLAKYSLGIFALHKYLFLLMLLSANIILAKHSFPIYTNVLQVQFYWLHFLLVVLAILLTLFSVYVFDFSPFNKLIR